MHEDHRQARQEHALRMVDIGEWRVKNRKALAILARIEAAVREHDAELEAHAADMGAHELQIEWHELALPDHEGAGGELDGDELAARHLRFKWEHGKAGGSHTNHQERCAQFAAELTGLVGSLRALF